MTVISFQHRFIFVKARKVAGTSVEAFLRTLTGPDDVVTRFTPRDEHYCASRGWYSKNYAKHSGDEQRYTDLVLAERFDEALAYGRKMRKRIDSHMKARDIRRRIGRRTFNEFFKFCVVRDPYSWLVSQSGFDRNRYHEGQDNVLALNDLRERIREKLLRRDFLSRSNHAYYTIGRRLAVDRLVRFEHLQEDLAAVLEQLNIDARVDVPRLKENPQPWSTSEIFTPELDALVRERCAPMFEALQEGT